MRHIEKMIWRAGSPPATASLFLFFLMRTALALGVETPDGLDIYAHGNAVMQQEQTVAGIVLELDGTEGSYGVVQPEAAWTDRPNFRAEVRVRLDAYRGGSVPFGWPGRFWIYVNGEGKPWAILETAGGRIILSGDEPLRLGQWADLAVEYRAEDVSLFYVNGRSVAATRSRGPLPSGNAELWLGRYRWFDNGEPRDVWLEGAIAEPRLTVLPDDARFELDSETLANAMNVSWGDAIVLYEGWRSLSRPEHAIPFVEECQRLGVRTVYLRSSSEFIVDYCHRHTMDENHWYIKALSAVEGDPRASIVAKCQEAEITVYAYHTIFDEGSPPSVLYGGTTPYPWQSHFTIGHPQFLMENRDGSERQWGVLCYAYPEARAYTVNVFKDLVSRRPYDGIYICTRTHSRPAAFADQFGFNQPIVAEYERRYGVDIRTEPFSKPRWWDLQGEYFTQLLREIRAALPGKEIAVAIPRADYIGAPYGNMRLDWRTWVEEGLIDALVVGVYSGRFLYPDDNDRPGYVQSEQDGIGIRPLEYDLGAWFGPTCEKHGVALYLQRSSIVTDKDRELLEYPGVRGFMVGF